MSERILRSCNVSQMGIRVPAFLHEHLPQRSAPGSRPRRANEPHMPFHAAGHASHEADDMGAEGFEQLDRGLERGRSYPSRLIHLRSGINHDQSYREPGLPSAARMMVDAMRFASTRW